MSIKHHYDLITRPIVTEKSTYMGELGKYVFEISKRANKANVKTAIEKIFNVKVKKVNILNQDGKTKRFKGTKGKRVDKKRAVVTLEKDNSIDITGGVN